MTKLVTTMPEALNAIKELTADRDRALALVDKLNMTAQAVLEVLSVKKVLTLAEYSGITSRVSEEWQAKQKNRPV